jgi:hypothetical protein
MYFAILLSIAIVGQRPAVFSAGELCLHLDDAQKRVESLYVVYQSGDMSQTDPQLAAGSYLHRIVAANRSGYYLHWSAHGNDLMNWEDDPFQQRLFVDLNRWYNFNPVSNYFTSGELGREDPLPGSAPYEFVFAATGIWPLSRPAPQFRGEPYYLHQVASCGFYVFVRPNQEQVRGRWCHVLERPGVDRLWIDSERKGTLMAREIYDSKKGTLVQRFELSEHVEVSPNIWLPKKIRNMRFETRGSPTEPVKVKDSVLTFLEISANSVHNDVFVFKPRRGALQINGSGPPTQIAGGGIEHLDRIVAWTCRFAVPTPPKHSQESLLKICVFGFGFLYIAISEVRRIKKPQANTSPSTSAYS